MSSLLCPKFTDAYWFDLFVRYGENTELILFWGDGTIVYEVIEKNTWD